MCRIVRLPYKGRSPPFGGDISFNQVYVSASAAELTGIELRVTGFKVQQSLATTPRATTWPTSPFKPTTRKQCWEWLSAFRSLRSLLLAYGWWLTQSLTKDGHLATTSSLPPA
jgi:hypothetical protein